MSPTPYLAPSLVNFRNEVNDRWPNRDKRSDGWIGDAAHAGGVTDLDRDGKITAHDAALKSQHNPDEKGCVHAIDIDTDGVNADVLVNAFKHHPGAWYVIFNRRIWSATYQWEPKPYQGTDPHTAHLHFSILLTIPAETSEVPWGIFITPPAPEETEMKPKLCKTATDPHQYGVYVASGTRVYLPTSSVRDEWCKRLGVPTTPEIVSAEFLNLFQSVH